VWDPDTQCNIHEGFLQVANAVLQDVQAQHLLKPDAELRFIGHSQGGAVAIVLAMKLYDAGYNIGKIICFGTPKVSAFCTYTFVVQCSSLVCCCY
jgi:surfactin synthase thioesterase subunit